jgi:hypothetical protein
LKKKKTLSDLSQSASQSKIEPVIENSVIPKKQQIPVERRSLPQIDAGRINKLQKI